MDFKVEAKANNLPVGNWKKLVRKADAKTSERIQSKLNDIKYFSEPKNFQSPPAPTYGYPEVYRKNGLSKQQYEALGLWHTSPASSQEAKVRDEVDQLMVKIIKKK